MSGYTRLAELCVFGFSPSDSSAPALEGTGADVAPHDFNDLRLGYRELGRQWLRKGCDLPKPFQ
jgi:hypothetical protein